MTFVRAGIKYREVSTAHLPVLMVVGENAFQMIDSQILVAMKREIPEPRPYPF